MKRFAFLAILAVTASLAAQVAAAPAFESPLPPPAEEKSPEPRWPVPPPVTPPAVDDGCVRSTDGSVACDGTASASVPATVETARPAGHTHAVDGARSLACAGPPGYVLCHR